MSQDNVSEESELPRAITGAGGVAPNYAAMSAGDVATRAGSVAPNYAVSVETNPADPAPVVEASEASDST